MKATIEFDLDNADDLNSYELHNKSLDMGLLLWKILYETKNMTKVEFRKWFIDELNDRGINIEKLIQ